MQIKYDSQSSRKVPKFSESDNTIFKGKVLNVLTNPYLQKDFSLDQYISIELLALFFFIKGQIFKLLLILGLFPE